MKLKLIALSLAVQAFSITNMAYSQENSVTNTQTQPPPVVMSANDDHQRIMDLLGMKTIRRGADGNNAQSPFYANYDESKANPYPTLPDPLVFNNGKSVKSSRDWWKRRPEIVELFDENIYGRIPANTPSVKWVVTSTSTDTKGTYPSITKNLTGFVDNSSYPQIAVNIELTLTTPLHAKGPVPVIMQFGFPRGFAGFGGFGFRPRTPAPAPAATGATAAPAIPA